MGILVVASVAHILHQRSRRIAQMQRHRQISGLLYEFHGIVKPCIWWNYSGRQRQIDRTLASGIPASGNRASNSLKRSIGQQKRVRIGKASISSAARISSRRAMNSGSSPPLIMRASQVESGIRVRTADTLDKGRDDIKVHFSVLVIGRRIFLEPSVTTLSLITTGSLPAEPTVRADLLY